MTTATAAWATVYRGIKNAIDNGDYPPGGPISSEKTLIDTYGVSRTSVRSALTRLEGEGVLNPGGPNRRRSVRVESPLYWNLSKFETGPRRDDPDTGTDEWAADMRAQGKTPRQDVTVKFLRATPIVAAGLNVDTGELVVRRRRLRFADEEPVTIADTYITDATAKRSCLVDDEEVFPFLEERDIAVHGGIVKAVGFNQDHADDTIYPRLPTEEEAELLSIPKAGVSVGEHTRIGREPDGTPIRMLVSVFPGPRLSLHYTVKFR